MDVSEAKRFFEQTERLYEQHGKPLEQAHLWKYVAIQPDAKTIVEDDHDVLAAQAKVELGKGSYIFRLGGIIPEQL